MILDDSKVALPLSGGKELVLASLINRKVQGARTIFLPQLSKLPRFGRTERENWAALIYELGDSDQNQLWDLVHSTKELTGWIGMEATQASL